MRLICISDVHNKISELDIPSGDLLVISGDLTGHGSIAEFGRFNYDIGKIKKKKQYRHGVLIIFGNHDFLPEKDFGLAKSMLTNIDYILHDSEAVIDGKRFWGSAFTPRFYNWSFNLDRGAKIKAKWDLIPDGVDVLITHGPVAGIHDINSHGEAMGCADLLDAVLKVKPKVHICGHNHNGYGVKESYGITFINASSCNERYMLVNPPIEFEV
jgi:Icc-related predicted phosphoesterase